MAPVIEDYEFGRIQIDGKTFRSDVIVCPDGVRPDWWRKDGHGLDPNDVEAVLDEVRPDKLIIGCGANGALTVPETTRKWIEKKGVELIALPSKQACEKYNELSSSKSVVAGLHLTC
jgi:hypothetical protein